jgi:hypothetical protein
MCLACDMEWMWFAALEARAAAGESLPKPDEPATLLASGQQAEAAALLPPPERGRVGEGVAGPRRETTGGVWEESQDPHPNPPPEGGGGGAPAAPEGSNSAHQRSAPPHRFACDETLAE